MMASPESAEALRARIDASFHKQGIMGTLGARLARVERGRVDVEIDPAPGLTQQRGFVHAGVIATIADTAGGYAALTTMAPDDDVVAIEFKVNMLRPAVGARFVAQATVLRSGASICVCRIDVHAMRGDESVLVATMTQTNFRVGTDTLRPSS